MKSLITLLTTLFVGLAVYAHEGHLKAPGTLAAPHGGQVKGTSQLYIELVSDSAGFKIYVLDHDFKSIPAKDVKIEGTAQVPKQKKSEKLTLNPSESFLEAKFDAKGSHRYTVDLKISHKGKTESLSFNVEPQ